MELLTCLNRWFGCFCNIIKLRRSLWWFNYLKKWNEMVRAITVSMEMAKQVVSWCYCLISPFCNHLVCLCSHFSNLVYLVAMSTLEQRLPFPVNIFFYSVEEPRSLITKYIHRMKHIENPVGNVNIVAVPNEWKYFT